MPSSKRKDAEKKQEPAATPAAKVARTSLEAPDKDAKLPRPEIPSGGEEAKRTDAAKVMKKVLPWVLKQQNQI